MADAERARIRMVDALRDAGRVHTASVEHAFRSVPRHLFLPGLPIESAYADEAVAVQFDDGVATSSASQPSMMAIMLEQLDLRPGQRVLEIGAGTGYNAALMTSIVGRAGAVTAVDIDQELVERAATHLAAAGIQGVELVVGDGALGHPAGAPYDRIVLTVGSDDVRPEWIAQLAPGGRLLLPLDVRGSQLSMALDLGPDGVLRSASVRSCAFIRLRGVGASPEAGARLDTVGVVLQTPEDTPGADRGAVTAALGEPGELVPAAVALSGVDVWDGFGLWLALTEPRTCRLFALEPKTGLPAGLLPLGRTGGTLALATAPDDALPGLAVVVPASGAPVGGVPVPVGVRSFGTGGPALAARLLAALERWAGAGEPEAMDWRFTVVPRPDAEAGADTGGDVDGAPGTDPDMDPDPDTDPMPVAVAVGVVTKRHSRVLATLPSGHCEGSRTPMGASDA